MEYGFILACSLLAVSIAYVIAFQFREGIDERGRAILSSAYSTAYLVLIVALGLAMLLIDWSGTVQQLTAKDIVLLLMCLSGMSAAGTVFVLKRKR